MNRNRIFSGRVQLLRPETEAQDALKEYILLTENTALSPSTNNRALPLGPSLFTALLCVLFGANAVAIKVSLSGIGTFTGAGVRFGLAAIIIYFWARCTGKPLALKKGQIRHLCLLAILFYIQLSCFYFGLSKTTASHGTLIVNVLPFVVMILAHFFIPGDSINRSKIYGLVLGFAGVLLLFLDTVIMTSEAVHGDLLVLLTVFLWSGHAIYVKKIIGDFHPIQITLYPLAMAAPLFLLSGYLWDPEMIRYLDGQIISSMFYQTFVTASFGLVAWNTMVQRFGAVAVHSFVFIMPLSGVFFGIILLKEPLTVKLIGSILLVVSGLIVVNRSRVNRS